MLQEPRGSGRLRTTEGTTTAHVLHAHPDSPRLWASVMTGLQLDDGVRTLLVTKLDSYEKLEIMRALRGAGPGMSRSELEAACRLSTDAVDDALPSLERSKLVEHDRVNHWMRLGAASEDPCFAALMQTYDEDRAAVLAVLSSAVMQRLRSMTAQAFADAFVIRKKGRDDG